MRRLWDQLVHRHWQLFVAVVAFLVFTLVHTLVFRPALARYARVTQQAARLGVPLDAVSAAPGMPASVASLLADNSLEAAAAEEQGASGALTAALLGDVTRLAARRGLQVSSTEQGLMSQLPGSIVVRAHFTMSGSYGMFVDLLGDFARTGTLITLDRFEMTVEANGRHTTEIWVSRLILKRTGAPR